jgi:uncharacterized membrane protein YdjX (TVP38/TMEM64 family)
VTSTNNVDWKQARPTLALGGVWVVLPALLGFALLARLDLAAQWLDACGEGAIVVYILVFAITSGLGLLPTYAQALAGGWIFGLPLGTLGALAGFVGGSVMGRVVSRLVARKGLDTVFEQAPRAAAVRDALIGRGGWSSTGIITLLRVPPNSPFALTNLALTACGARWVPYLVGTAVGMLPRTAIVVGMGAAGAATGAKSIAEMLEQTERRWMLIGGIIAMVIVLAILAAIGRRALDKVTRSL